MPNFAFIFWSIGCTQTEGLKVHNSVPSINITSHSSGAILDENEEYIFLATVSDPNHDASQLRTEWFLSGRKVCEEDPISAQLESICAVIPQAGDDELRVIAYDIQGASDDDAISFALNENQPPSVQWISEEGIYMQNETLVLSAVLHDDRTAVTDLLLSWQSTVGTVVAYDTVSSEGVLTSIVELPLGEQIIQLFVTDGEGAQGSASLFIDMQEGSVAPLISWIAPAPGLTLNEGEQSLQVAVADEEDGNIGLPIVFHSDLDGELGSIVSDSQGLGIMPVALSIGAHVLTAEVEDSSGVVNTAINSVVINDLPSAPSLSFSPAQPVTDDDVQVVASGSIDLEGDVITYSYEWVYGTSQWSGDILPSSMTEKGEQWTVRVTPSDPMGAGGFTEASILIENAAPTITMAEIVPANPTVSDVLSVNLLGSDIDGDVISYSYDWSVNGTTVGTNDSLSAGFVRGDGVAVVITPDDGSVLGIPVQVGPKTIENSPPSAPTIAISPVAPVEAVDDLICTIDVHSTDADGDPVQYAFSWLVNGVPYTGAVDSFLPGDTVPAGDTIAGEDWTCIATPNDGLMDGNTDSVMVTVQADDGCPSGFTLAFDITDDSSDQIPNDCAWLWDNLFSLGTQFSFEWWGNNQHYGPSVWDFSSEIVNIEQSYNGCSGSNYNLPSSDGLYFMTLVQYNDLLHIHPFNDPAEDGNWFYYGRISATYSQDDEIYAIGYSSWTQAWQNRFQSGDRFLACYQ